MHKFTCDKCDGNCELVINVDDMEDVLPEFCPSHDMAANWSSENLKGKTDEQNKN